jgi:hypothetical protein
MKKRKVLLLLSMVTAVLLISSCSHKVVYTNKWQNDDFTELSKAETGQSLRFYDKKSNLQYEVTNDNKNLYICIKATDQQLQNKITKAGMKVGIDTLGKKKPQVHILYPFPVTRQQNGSSNQNQGRHSSHRQDTGSHRSQSSPQFGEIHLSGFYPPINGILPPNNDYGISINIMWDTMNTMYYKAIIPFNTFYKDSLAASDSTTIFGFSIAVNEAVQQPGSRGGNGGIRPSGGIGIGMGGGIGFGMGGIGISTGMGGGRGGGGGGNPSHATAANVDIRIKLASQPQQK